MHVCVNNFKFHLRNNHTLHPWIHLSWEALPCKAPDTIFSLGMLAIFISMKGHW